MEMEFKYANMLNILALTFLFSTTIPILYLIAATYFVVAYWTDKFLILRCY
jgi:hypothetical protein